MARRLNIVSRFKEGPHVIASLRDFEVTEGETIDPNTIIDDSQVSLYCLDSDRREAIFVEHSTDLDLTKAAFINQTQHETARSLIAVPFETFARMSESLPEVSQPIFIYNIGRVGSTLLSHVLNDTNLVTCLSEPDAIDHLVPMRDETGGDRDEELRELAQSTIRILFKDERAHKRYALKFRSEGHRVMDLLQVAFPETKNIFLYRDPVGFVASVYRLIKQNLDMPEYATFDEWKSFYSKFLAADLSYLRAYVSPQQDVISIPEQLGLQWVAQMEWYLEQVELGVPVLAVRYEDLSRYRETSLRAIFAYCDLPEDGIERGLNAFDRDAQAGTALARQDAKQANKLMLNEKQVQSITEILHRHPVLNTPNYIAPQTFQP